LGMVLPLRRKHVSAFQLLTKAVVHCCPGCGGVRQTEVDTRVKQIRNLVEQTEQDYEKEKLSERIARLSGGVAIIQVGCQGNLIQMGAAQAFAGGCRI